MRSMLVGATAGVLALVGASPGLGAKVATTATAVPRDSTVLVVGTGFAPPNEFCRRPVVTIDGRPARVTGRISDDAGGWAFRVVASQAPGRHAVAMSQACENGNTGAIKTTVARTNFRIFA
jgi:hypothetical protein